MKTSTPTRKRSYMLAPLRAAKHLAQRISRFLRTLRVHRYIQHLFGPTSLTLSNDEFLVVCVVRDAEAYIDSFVDHYQSLGAKHLLFLDNGSVDSTLERLRTKKNITVLQSFLPFRKYKYAFSWYLASFYGKNMWVLSVDVDELFDYPLSGRKSMRELLSYLHSRNYNAVPAHMLDLYSHDFSPSGTTVPGTDLSARYRLYEIDSIERRRGYSPHFDTRQKEMCLQTCLGGVKKRMFNAGVLLTKTPLCFFDEYTKPGYESKHIVKHCNLADFTAVLYHYPFIDGCRTKIETAVREKNYAHNSRYYRDILDTLNQTPGISLVYDHTLTLDDVNDLIDNEFLTLSETFKNWALS